MLNAGFAEVLMCSIVGSNARLVVMVSECPTNWRWGSSVYTTPSGAILAIVRLLCRRDVRRKREWFWFQRQLHRCDGHRGR